LSNKKSWCTQGNLSDIGQYLHDTVLKDFEVYYYDIDQKTAYFYYSNNQKIGKYFADDWKKIIACNNPNIDIPKVVDKVEQLAHKYFAEERFNWEQENPNGLKSPQSLVEHYNKTFTPLFKAGYNKSQETHPFSEEDMIKFAVFYQKHQGRSLEYWGKDLFKIWKEQQPKIVYYE
jgi:hypothetical protein